MGEFSNVYRTVTSNVRSYGPMNVNIQEMAARDRAAKAIREQTEYNDRLMAANEARLKKEAVWETKNAKSLLDIAKSKALNEAARRIPDELLSEAFNKIYIKVFDSNPVVEGDFDLIDRKYVIDNYLAFKNMSSMYMRKLGGYNYLKSVALESDSPFIRNLYSIITETTKNALSDRNKKASKCYTESEVKEMIQPKPTDSEREEVLKKIDSLGADELAELVHSKVVKVVADVGHKAKNEQEFQNLLKSDLKDGGALVEPSQISGGSATPPPPTSTGTEDGADIGSPEGEDVGDEGEDIGMGDMGGNDLSADTGGKPEKKDTEADNKEKTPAKDIKDKKKEVKEQSFESLIESYNPIDNSFTYKGYNKNRSLFGAMMESVTREMICSATESYQPTDPNSLPKNILNNPLNLDIFRAYLAENSTKPYEYHTKRTTNEVALDSSVRKKVWGETIIQYALIETAHTMKLINPTVTQIAEQCKFLCNIKQ